jgi:hypothetical protein
MHVSTGCTATAARVFIHIVGLAAHYFWAWDPRLLNQSGVPMPHELIVLIDQLRELLAQQQYNSVVIHNYCRSAECFLEYLARQGIAVDAATPQAAQRLKDDIETKAAYARNGRANKLCRGLYRRRSSGADPARVACRPAVAAGARVSADARFAAGSANTAPTGIVWS